MIDVLPSDYWRDLARLMAAPSVKDLSSASAMSPFGSGIDQALSVMEEIGARDGFLVRDVARKACALSVEGKKPFTFAFLAHLDVVPAIGTWHVPPFSLTRKDGRAYGRGIVDDKGPGLAAYYALRTVTREAGTPPLTFMALFGTDEENDSTGLKEYLKNYPAPDASFSPDASFPLVLGEKGIESVDLRGQAELAFTSLVAKNAYNLVPALAVVTFRGADPAREERARAYAASHGLECLSDQATISFLGESHHACEPAGGVNALAHLLAFLATECPHPFLSELRSRLLFDFNGKALGCAHEDPIMGAVTVNLANMEYHDGTFRIGLNIRVPRSVDFARVEHALDRFTTIQTHEVIARSEGFCQDESSPLASLLLSSYRTVTGDESAPLHIGGGTYARECPHSLAFGPTLPGRADACHVADESIREEDLETAYRVYLSVFRHAGALLA